VKTETEIEQLLTYLERRKYPARWISDYKTPEPPIDGIPPAVADEVLEELGEAAAGAAAAAPAPAPAAPADDSEEEEEAEIVAL